MPDEIDRPELNKTKKDNPKCCILEVNLEYPKELHDLHNNYRVTPEKTTIRESMLSNDFKKLQV